MVAGAQYRGQFEERLKAVLEEIKQSEGQIITFLDELHTLVGPARPRARWTPATCSSRCWPAASCGWSAPPRSTSTAPASRRTRRWSGASSRCSSASRRSRTPSASCAGSRAGTKRTTASPSATRAGRGGDPVRPLHHGRFLPDKAIDLIDEAASRLRMEIDSRPVEIDELQRAVDRMRMEELAARARTTRRRCAAAGPAPRWRTSRSARALIARWEQEKSGLNRSVRSRSSSTTCSGQAERAQRDGDFEAASRLMYAEIPALEKQWSRRPRRRVAGGDGQGGGRPDDVAEVVAAWTGIPAGRLLEGETAKLLRMEDELHKRSSASTPP
jgi:ATP-dependent Clp protease ATP-binding subunit ClpB